MKTRFTNAMCAHIWAQQNQSHGHSDNMHFTDSTLYSYKMPIARFVTTYTGKKVVLRTSEKFSVTTSSKHEPAVSRALSNSIKVFHVPCLNPLDHDKNLRHLVGAYAKRVQQEMCRVKWYDDSSILGTLLAYTARVSDYASAFGLTDPWLGFEPDGDARKIDARRERLTSPEAQARREAARPGYEAKRQKARDAKEARELEARVLRLQKLSAVRIRYSKNATGEDVVQTSLGAKVPLPQALRAVEFIRRVRVTIAAQGPWTRDEAADLPCTRVGQFTIDRIDAAGIRAGCHFVSWAELDRVFPEGAI
jgi:hypothetical protein